MPFQLLLFAPKHLCVKPAWCRPEQCFTGQKSAIPVQSKYDLPSAWYRDWHVWTWWLLFSEAFWSSGRASSPHSGHSPSLCTWCNCFQRSSERFGLLIHKTQRQTGKSFNFKLKYSFQSIDLLVHLEQVQMKDPKNNEQNQILPAHSSSFSGWHWQTDGAVGPERTHCMSAGQDWPSQSSTGVGHVPPVLGKRKTDEWIIKGLMIIVWKQSICLLYHAVFSLLAVSKLITHWYAINTVFNSKLSKLHDLVSAYELKDILWT